MAAQQLRQLCEGSPRVRQYLELLFNGLGTHVPSHRFRQTWLRALGAQIGTNVGISRGTSILSPHKLVVGDRCAVGWRCVLDARGGIVLGDDVVLASDVQLITADHDIDDGQFGARLGQISVQDHAWLATRATVLRGVKIGQGGVVAAGAIVTGDVDAFTVVGGVPAKPIATRKQVCTYRVEARVRFF